MTKRIKTGYPGVFYRIADRIGGPGKEKVFYAVYKKDGKVYERKVGRQFTDNMTAAKAARRRGEYIEGKDLPRKEKREIEAIRKAKEDSKWTIDRLFNAYMEDRKPGKGKDTDRGRYEKYLKDAFGKKEPSEILPLDVDRVRIRLLKTKSPQTVRHILNLLTWTINYGVNNGLCAGLRFRIQKPPVDNTKTEDLTADELRRLLAAIDHDSHPQAGPMMKLVLCTGMRRGELFRLKWADVDFDRGFIVIRNPKGGRDQTIPLNDAARNLLGKHPRTSEYVFPGRSGGQRVDINKAVNEIKKAAGLPADFRPLHGLRHVYASMLASSGQVDMYQLQKLLTHKNAVMTQRYAHLRDEALKRAAGVASDIITGAMNGTK